MNMRSSTGRQEKANNADRSRNGLSTTARPALRVQKRWQPRARRVDTAIAPRAAAPLSHTELETALRQEALQAAQRGDHQEAIALFTMILEQNPSSARDYNNRGLVYFQSGDMERAIADYNQALALDSTLDSVYNNRANYYATQGKFLEAILDYDAALNLNPTNVRAWLNQGITLRELEMHDRALECFDFALRLGRLEAHIYAERGRTHHLWGDWNAALADYQRAIERLLLPNTATPGGAARLRLQIEVWKDELLAPLESEP
ncbi:tetratricopeptide repeat protein [Thermoleptolyngbya sp. M55_K2018_002]|uniref:tetratricopeptide repeat protein n=1 Tax=Thermoleptolyngbya sp. M55_K2018_002 TaxID=2747808 RepID=UPI0019E30AB5|nr:tetratricopeptide repeat protein [Thermoleptolyngbya sp. M55_K2018_002]HIK39421.1 tetratricopeptide repeat protein [Thermoleptolyngbya sp. M55_K2018_002]